MAAGRQVDADHGAEVLDDGPDHHGHRVPGEVCRGGEYTDVSDADDARYAGTVGCGKKRGGRMISCALRVAG